MSSTNITNAPDPTWVIQPETVLEALEKYSINFDIPAEVSQALGIEVNNIKSLWLKLEKNYGFFLAPFNTYVKSFESYLKQEKVSFSMPVLYEQEKEEAEKILAYTIECLFGLRRHSKELLSVGNEFFKDKMREATKRPLVSFKIQGVVVDKAVTRSDEDFISTLWTFIKDILADKFKELNNKYKEKAKLDAEEKQKQIEFIKETGLDKILLPVATYYAPEDNYLSVMLFLDKTYETALQSAGTSDKPPDFFGDWEQQYYVVVEISALQEEKLLESNYSNKFALSSVFFQEESEGVNPIFARARNYFKRLGFQDTTKSIGNYRIGFLLLSIPKDLTGSITFDIIKGK